MEILEYSPQGQTRHTFDFKTLNIMPLGDIQAGPEESDLDLLRKNVKRGLEADAYFIGMGDYLDVASPSNRKIIAGSGLYDSVTKMMDDRMREEEEMLLRILEPTKGRWLGMLTGHHWWLYQDGTTSDTNLCRALETTHLGTCAMMRLKFRDANGHAMDCVIWAHHGVGAGASATAPITKLEKVMNWAEADIYLMGHQHKRVGASQPRFYISEGKTPVLIAREKKLIGTGSYLKGYMQGSKKGGIAAGGYVEEAMMTPVALGSPLISITPQRLVRGDVEITDLEITVTT